MFSPPFAKAAGNVTRNTVLLTEVAGKKQPTALCFVWVLVFLLNLVLFSREVARAEGGLEGTGRKVGWECMVYDVKSRKNQ